MFGTIIKTLQEFVLWLSGNESDYCPWGCRFDPWHHSVGYGSGTAMSCGIGHRHGWDLALLWLGCRPVVTALIQPLAWEPPYVTGMALKRPKKKKKKNNNNNNKTKPKKEKDFMKKLFSSASCPMNWTDSAAMWLSTWVAEECLEFTICWLWVIYLSSPCFTFACLLNII